MRKRSCHRGKALVKAPYMFAGFDGAVLRKVLRECHHQRFALVQYIDFLTLCLGKTIGFYDTENRYQSAQAEKRQTENTYLPETAFDIF